MTRKTVLVKERNKRRDTSAYWEARLKRMGLTVDAGRAEWISYGHDTARMDFDGRHVFVPAISGESLELDEWPLSLS
jgi:hypothetical protein